MTTSQSQRNITDEELRRLLCLLRSLNASRSDELGDFRCLKGASYNVARNNELRCLLETIHRHATDGEGVEANSPLMLDFSQALIEGLLPNSTPRRVQTLVAMKGFLRNGDCSGATKFFGVGSLVRSLPQQLKIVSINISRNALDDQDAVEASEAFRGLLTLVELDMSYNQIGAEGTTAMFSVLLDHPMCRIQRLHLQWNWKLRLMDDGQSLEVDFLQRKIIEVLRRNRSLTYLNLGGVPSSASLEKNLARSIYDFSDVDHLFGLKDKYNHHLRFLLLGTHRLHRPNATDLPSALAMNNGGPEEALARKIEHHLERNRTIFEVDGDPRSLVQCLEYVGKYGNVSSMLKLVHNFTVRGSLFGAA
ncbi:hypothetical protein ACHAWF_008892 [Thalassiosira exigua]